MHIDDRTSEEKEKNYIINARERTEWRDDIEKNAKLYGVSPEVVKEWRRRLMVVPSSEGDESDVAF